MIVPDHQRLHAEAGAQHAPHEFRGGQRCEIARERQDGAIVDTDGRQRLEFLHAGRQEHRHGTRPHNLVRMRRERHQDTGHLVRACPSHEPQQHVKVTKVHAVKCPDGDRGALHVRWERRDRARVRHRA